MQLQLYCKITELIFVSKHYVYNSQCYLEVSKLECCGGLLYDHAGFSQRLAGSHLPVSRNHLEIVIVIVNVNVIINVIVIVIVHLGPGLPARLRLGRHGSLQLLGQSRVLAETLYSMVRIKYSSK